MTLRTIDGAPPGGSENDADLTVLGLTLPPGTTIQDNAGNAANLAGAVRNPAGTLQIDTPAPAITSVVANPATADLNAGKSVTLTVNFSEVANVAGGTPFLSLSRWRDCELLSGSGSKALTFNHTVAAGENSADLTVLGLTLPAGVTIEDNAGNERESRGCRR